MSVAWADTNILLRHLSGEPAALSKRANRAIEDAKAGRLRLRVPTEIVCELVFVLGGKTFGYTRAEIAARLTVLLTTQGIEPEETDICLVALQRMGELGVPFVDALLATRAQQADEPVVTLDERDFPKLGVALRPI